MYDMQCLHTKLQLAFNVCEGRLNTGGMINQCRKLKQLRVCKLNLGHCCFSPRMRLGPNI